MTDSEFKQIREEACQTADGLVFKTFETFQPDTQKAHMFLQVLAVRVFANIIGSAMFEKGRTFEEVFYPLKNGIYKESIFIIQEIHNGDREAIELK